MNKEKRLKIDKIINTLDEIHDEIDELLEQEDEDRDAMPDSLLESEQYEVSEESSEYLQEALAGIEDVLESLDAAKEE